MKKSKLFLIAGLLMAVVSFVACSSDDDNKNDTEDFSIEGEWQFKSVDFLEKEDVEWDDELDFNAGNTVKYAPYMLSEVWGYDFRASEIGEGKKVYVMQGFYQDYDEDEVLWVWNETDEEGNFEIEQMNDQFPPYDFGIRNVEIQEVNHGGDEVVFTATIASREVGSEFTDPLLEVPVEMTWERGTPTAENEAEILIEGETFEFPEN